MSLKIKALRIQKQLLGWLQSEGVHFRSLATSEIESLTEGLRKVENRWSDAMSYEVSGVTVLLAIAVVMEGLKAMMIERIVVWLGDSEEPLVVEVLLSDFGKVLENSARTEGVLSITTSDCQGRATIVFPGGEGDDDFLISGVGQFESLVKDIRQRLPGGCLLPSALTP